GQIDRLHQGEVENLDRDAEPARGLLEQGALADAVRPDEHDRLVRAVVHHDELDDRLTGGGVGGGGGLYRSRFSGVGGGQGSVWGGPGRSGRDELTPGGGEFLTRAVARGAAGGGNDETSSRPAAVSSLPGPSPAAT